MPSKIIRYALVVDDEQILCVLIKEILESNGFVVEIAHNATEARELLMELEVDIAIIDLDLGPGPSGVDLARYMADNHREVARLVLTRFPDLVSAGFAQEDLPSGTGMVPKSEVSNADVFLQAIDKTLDGTVISFEQDLKPPFSELTRNQLWVLRMLAQGYSVQEIAKFRNKTRSSVEKLITSIYGVLELSEDSLNQRSEAIRLYIQRFGVPSRVESHIVE